MVSQVILGVRYDMIKFCVLSCVEFYTVQDMEHCKEKQAGRNYFSTAIHRLDRGEFLTRKSNICHSPDLV